jgi:hypothetical protein
MFGLNSDEVASATAVRLKRANSQQLELFDPLTGIPLNAEAQAFCVACWNMPLADLDDGPRVNGANGSGSAADDSGLSTRYGERPRSESVSADNKGTHRRGQSVGTFHVDYADLERATDSFNVETHLLGGFSPET